MELVERLRAIYRIIDERGLFIAPENDLVFSPDKRLAINANGSESVELAKESYNSNLLFALLAGIMKSGTMIFYGPPGAGKTTTSELVGHFLYGMSLDDIQKATIYGHPEQTKEEMIARHDLGEMMAGVEKILKREFMESPVGIIDEMPRLPPGKLSILYQLIDRGFCKVASEVVKRPEGPIYMTSNAADSGSHPVPLPFLDRVDVAVITPHLNPFFIPNFDSFGNTELNGSLEERLHIPNELRINPRNDLQEIRKQILSVKIDPDVLYRLIVFVAEINYCDMASETVDKKTKGHLLFKTPARGLCDGCHYKANICAYTDNGISPRTYRAILAYSRALAWWRGKDKVSAEELEQVIPFTTWHKIALTRTLLDKKPVYINDKINAVRHIYRETSQTVDKLKDIIKEYDGIINIVSRFVAGEEIDPEHVRVTIASQIESLKNIDSVVKFPLATTLVNLYKAAA